MRQLLKILQQSPDKSYGYGAGNIINLLQQLNIDLTSYDFSDLTIWQADLQTVALHQVNFSNCDLSRSVLAKQLSNIYTLAFNPDETLLASGNSQGEVTIWRIQDGKQILCCRGHQGIAIAVAFSPDGQYLATASHDETIKIWHIHSKKCCQTFKLQLLYEDMDITDAKGLTIAEQETLMTLGAKSRSITSEL